LQTPLRLIFHPSAEKHVAAMAILNVVVEDSAKVRYPAWAVVLVLAIAAY
jgi:hypothetical protein